MARSAETKLMELRPQAPDLAETVTEERITVNEAYAAFEARKREIQDVIDFAKQYIVRDINTFATKVSTIVRALKHTNELVPDREVVDQVFEAAGRPMGNPETIRAWEDDLYDQATESCPDRVTSKRWSRPWRRCSRRSRRRSGTVALDLIGDGR